MFYKRFMQLCDSANIAPSAAATKAGFNRGTVSVWKKKYEMGQDVTPDQEVINKVCGFFGCTESWLRGISPQNEIAPPEKTQCKVSDDDIKFALFGDVEIDDDILEEVKRFAQFAKEQKRERNFND